MRSFSPFLAGFLLLASPAFPSQPVEMAGPAEAGRVDTLFAELKRERKQAAAERIAARIQNRWLDSGSASVDLLMGWADTAIKEKKYGAALDFLDRVTVLQPGYPEGWNRRATVHFLMNNYGKSMLDIERTLRLEPRHFGALAGMGQILKATGRSEQALRAFARALEVYPMMRSAQGEYSALAEELADRGT